MPKRAKFYFIGLNLNFIVISDLREKVPPDMSCVLKRRQVDEWHVSSASWHRFHGVLWWQYQGRSDGIIITPKSVTVLFTCGTLRHVLKLQWLVKTYTSQSNSWLRHWAINVLSRITTVAPTSHVYVTHTGTFVRDVYESTQGLSCGWPLFARK